VTSLDRRIAQIYPMSVWRQNELFFENYREDPEVAENVPSTLPIWGEAEMDAQGRITFNPELRRELSLEGQELHLFAYKVAWKYERNAL